MAKRTYIVLTPLLLKERRLLGSIARDRRLVILNFHEIRPVPDPHAGPIHPDLFDELLAFIGKTFAVRSFDQLVEGGNEDRPIAVVSFDDGFRSFVDHAMPLLKRHGIRANHNVIPAALLGHRPFTVVASDLLRASPARLLRTLRLAGFDPRMPTDGPEDRAAFIVRLSNHLKLRPRSEREPLWAEVVHHLRAVDVKEPTPMMDVTDAREVARHHDVGVHSYEHETMAFEPMDYFMSDFERCRRFFDEELGIPMHTYAFPNGLARAEQVDWLKGQGIRDVLLVGDDFSATGAFVHHRFNMAAPTLRELRLQTLGLKASPLLSRSVRGKERRPPPC